ncbi:unnamed protein product [Calypogeia fissa]
MGFLLITLYYILAGLVVTAAIPICFNKGPATNTLHILLVITAVICCYLLWAIVYLAQWHPLVVPILNAEGE